MENRTTKILDNTVITAFLKEITSIKIIDRCPYYLITSKGVSKECEKFDKEFLEKFGGKLSIVNPTNKNFFEECYEYLQTRYPYLHKGEISTFLLALLEFYLKKRKYYFITDDNKMRKVILNLDSDETFLKIIKINVFKEFNISGTVGLIKRLYVKKTINEKELNLIIEDLKKSSFFITKELINFLKEK